MKKLLLSLLKVVVVFVGLAVVTAAETTVGVYLSTALLIYSGVAMFRALPGVGRGLAVPMALIAIVYVLVGATALNDQREARLAELKQQDPDAYLAELRERDDERWLSSLKEMRPVEYDAEISRRAALEARQRAERAAIEEKERAARLASACSKGNGSLAFVMQQDAVRSRLRAPATADFPSSADVQVLEGCRFMVRSYVDAQNGFGALIRTHYVSVIRHFPERRTWQVQSIEFLR